MGDTSPEFSIATTSRQRRLHWLLAGVLVVVVIVMAVQTGAKAGKNRSAFVRWRGQVVALVHGHDVYAVEEDAAASDDDREDETSGAYPNPPLMAIFLYPLAILPPVVGAVVWFLMKVAMTGIGIYWCARLAAGGGRRLPLWGVLIILLMGFRVIQSDLKHGNINLLIFFLTTLGVWAYSRGRDAWAGLTIALATSFKVTPALFVVYFAYKRQWRVVAWSLVGLGLFMLVVPGLVVGPWRNVELLDSWADAMIRPYAVRGEVFTGQINQSIPGLVHRLLTDSVGIEFKGDWTGQVNVASLERRTAGWIVKGVTAALLVWLAWVCRTPTRDRRDWRLAGEYGLVLIAMLLISERSWKHHYVTMILPYSVVVAHAALRASPEMRRWLWWALGAAFVLMASTSRELGGWMAHDGMGHKYAQAYGMFLLSGVVVGGAICVILLRDRVGARGS